jgi:hypothetical protein
VGNAALAACCTAYGDLEKKATVAACINHLCFLFLLASESNSFAEFSFITLFNRLSQVGIIVHGTTVDDLILGGPAYNSKKLAQGDVIIKVDSVEATEENINDLLIGKDVS